MKMDNPKPTEYPKPQLTNAEQAAFSLSNRLEASQGFPEGVIFELGFKGEAQVREGRSRRKSIGFGFRGASLGTKASPTTF